MRKVVCLAALAAVAGCDEPRPECEEAGQICTIAGTGDEGFDGATGKIEAFDAMFYRPTDVVWQPGTDNYAIVDWNNHRIRLVDGEGLIETIVGAAFPGDGPADKSDRTEPGAPGTTVALNHPTQVEWAPDGKLYLPNWHNHKVRVYDPATGNVLVTVANTTLGDGNGANGGFAGDGGPAADALLFFPTSIAFLPDGGYALLDAKNNRIRKIDTANIINTMAGSGTHGFAGDGGDALLASFAFTDAPTNSQPPPGGSIEADEAGNLYIVDTFNDCVRKIDAATGVITQIADGFEDPTDIEFGPDGRLYVMDTGHFQVVALDVATGAQEVVAGTGTDGVGEEEVPATESDLGKALGIDFADDGALLIADTWNNRIRRVVP